VEKQKFCFFLLIASGPPLPMSLHEKEKEKENKKEKKRGEEI
jgi:hypothetical protein